MDDMPFYVLFKSISVISGRWADDDESNKNPFTVERGFLPRAGLELETARSVGQCLTQ